MKPAVIKGPRPLHLRNRSTARTSSHSHDNANDREARLKRTATSRQVQRDAQSDAATTAFVRRVLCANHTLTPGADGERPLDELLPPLTSSNEVDLQLYAIIAVVIRDFVQAWYARITPDTAFVDEVVQVVAHCTRGLEQRLRRVDLEALLLDEIPDLVDRHLEAVRIARSRTDGALDERFRGIYHALDPHPALGPVPVEADPDTREEQRSNEAVWRQLLVEGITGNLLPPEDVRNPCLRVLVNEILGEMIIGNVLCAKLCEGWFLWDVTTKAILATRGADKGLDAAAAADMQQQQAARQAGRLDKYGLLETTSALHERQSEAESRRHWSRRTGISVYAIIINTAWEGARLLLVVVAALRTLFWAASQAASAPSRLPARSSKDVGGGGAHPAASLASSDSQDGEDPASAGATDFTTGDERVAILDMAIWRLPSSLVGLGLRMPWLAGIGSLLRRTALEGPGRIGGLDSRLDRYVSHRLTAFLADPALLPTLLRTVRAALFPSNALGPPAPPPPSTPAELAALRRRCAETILSCVPGGAREAFFGAGAGRARRAVEDEVLALWGDAFVNRHLVVGVLERVVCRLFPEVVVGGAAVREGVSVDRAQT